MIIGVDGVGTHPDIAVVCWPLDQYLRQDDEGHSLTPEFEILDADSLTGAEYGYTDRIGFMRLNSVKNLQIVFTRDGADIASGYEAVGQVCGPEPFHLES